MRTKDVVVMVLTMSCQCTALKLRTEVKRHTLELIVFAWV